MFAQLYQWVTLFLRKGTKNSRFTLTNEDRNRMDIAYEERLTRGDCEGLLTNVQGDVVGVTAVVTEDETIKKTEGTLPDGFQARFCFSNLVEPFHLSKTTRMTSFMPQGARYCFSPNLPTKTALTGKISEQLSSLLPNIYLPPPITYMATTASTCV
jgi:hypothetical protein